MYLISTKEMYNAFVGADADERVVAKQKDVFALFLGILCVLCAIFGRIGESSDHLYFHKVFRQCLLASPLPKNGSSSSGNPQ